MMYLLLLVATNAAAVGSAAYLAIYGTIANWRDPVAVNAWFGGLSVFLLSIASGMFLLGHYGYLTNYAWPLAVATLGFIVVAGVWIHRAKLVWDMSHPDDRT